METEDRPGKRRRTTAHHSWDSNLAGTPYPFPFQESGAGGLSTVTQTYTTFPASATAGQAPITQQPPFQFPPSSGGPSLGYGPGPGVQPQGQSSMPSTWQFTSDYSSYGQQTSPLSFPQYPTSQPFPNQVQQGTATYGSYYPVSQPPFYGQGQSLEPNYRQTINRPSLRTSVDLASTSSPVLAGSQPPTQIPYPFGILTGTGPTSHPAQMPHSQDAPAAAECHPSHDLLDDYEDQLQSAIEFSQLNRLTEAAESLMEATRTLLENTGNLSLFQDVISPDREVRPGWREKRLELWHNFNYTWLDLLLRQEDMSRQELQTGQRAQEPQSRINRNTLEKMGNELMRLGNGEVSNHGLIDCGETGVWHEQIVDPMLRCRELVLKLDGEFEQSPDFVMEELPPRPPPTTSQR